MFPVFQECRPLAIGIHKAVSERIPGINLQQLRLAMRMQTASARYLKALTNGETRFDLDGNAAAAVTPEQKEQALDTLRERFRRGGADAWDHFNAEGQYLSDHNGAHVDAATF